MKTTNLENKRLTGLITFYPSYDSTGSRSLILHALCLLESPDRQLALFCGGIYAFPLTVHSVAYFFAYHVSPLFKQPGTEDIEGSHSSSTSPKDVAQLQQSSEKTREDGIG